MILEGTRLTGKTDLAYALDEHPRIVGRRHLSAQVCQSKQGREYDSP